jgi:hypothetical protein
LNGQIKILYQAHRTQSKKSQKLKKQGLGGKEDNYKKSMQTLQRNIGECNMGQNRK